MTTCARSKSSRQHIIGSRVIPSGTMALDSSASSANRDIGPTFAGEVLSAAPLENARQAKPSILAL